MSLPDAVQSPDPIIRRLVQYWNELHTTAVQLRQHLTAYAVEVKPLAPMTVVSALEHYNMLDEQDCGCSLCTDWHTKRSEFVQAIKLIPRNHKWTVCGCDNCRFVGRIQLNFLAATNRRDLLIEMSFHARYHSDHGALVMAWLTRELQNPAYTVNWCAQEMSRFPMERWIKRCEMAVSGAVSGQVFCNSTMATDMVVNMGSSLTADVGNDFVGYF